MLTREDYRPVQLLQSPAHESIPFLSQITGDMNRHARALIFNGKKYGRVESFCRVMQGFPSSKVIKRRPRRDGPAIVELPDERAADALTVATPMFDAITNAFRLQQHAEIHERLEIFGHTESVGHLRNDQAI